MYPECSLHICWSNQLGAYPSGLLYSSGVSCPSSGSSSGHIQNLYSEEDEREVHNLAGTRTRPQSWGWSPLSLQRFQPRPSPDRGIHIPFYSGRGYCRSPPSRYRTAGSADRGGSIQCRVTAGAPESWFVRSSCIFDSEIDGSAK